ncbi:MAG: hypothetical protein JWN03_2231 [Nocardia sp.]|nr:hypothetical protein [Nocardia sp.]
MATGAFYYQDNIGNQRKLNDPNGYELHRVVMAAGELYNATDATVTLYADSDGWSGGDTMGPGDRKYSHAVYMSCRFGH